MERLHNAIWHLGHGLSVTSVVAESLERAVKKLEEQNGGKPFPRRKGELPKSPVKSIDEEIRIDSARFVAAGELIRLSEADVEEKGKTELAIPSPKDQPSQQRTNQGLATTLS